MRGLRREKGLVHGQGRVWQNGLFYEREGRNRQLRPLKNHESKRNFPVWGKGVKRAGINHGKRNVGYDETLSSNEGKVNIQHSWFTIEDKIETTINLLEVQITEGKNREIRKIFDKFGYNVIFLKRVSILIVS